MKTDAGAPRTNESCAALESAPPLVEPSAEEGVRLVTRDDAGSVDRTEVSLDELAGEGASVMIAALDSQTATRAVRWANSHRVPLIAMVLPDDSATCGRIRLHARRGPRRGRRGAGARGACHGQRVVPVIDASESSLSH